MQPLRFAARLRWIKPIGRFASAFFTQIAPPQVGEQMLPGDDHAGVKKY